MESFPLSFEVRLSLSRMIRSSLARVVRSRAPEQLVSWEEAELVVRLVEPVVLELVTWNTDGEIGEVGDGEIGSGMEVDFLILISGMVGGGGRVVLGCCGLSATGAVDGIRTISSAGRLSTGAG